MFAKINKTEEIKAKLVSEGKVSFLDAPEHMAAILKMNEEMEEVRREYKIKEKNSQISAAQIVLTA